MEITREELKKEEVGLLAPAGVIDTLIKMENNEAKWARYITWFCRFLVIKMSKF